MHVTRREKPEQGRLGLPCPAGDYFDGIAKALESNKAFRSRPAVDEFISGPSFDATNFRKDFAKNCVDIQIYKADNRKRERLEGDGDTAGT